MPLPKSGRCSRAATRPCSARGSRSGPSAMPKQWLPRSSAGAGLTGSTLATFRDHGIDGAGLLDGVVVTEAARALWEPTLSLWSERWSSGGRGWACARRAHRDSRRGGHCRRLRRRSVAGRGLVGSAGSRVPPALAALRHGRRRAEPLRGRTARRPCCRRIRRAGVGRDAAARFGPSRRSP